MGVIEAIGGLKLEEVAASLQIPAVIQKPQVKACNLLIFLKSHAQTTSFSSPIVRTVYFLLQ